MNKILKIGIVTLLVTASALVFAPLAVNAQTVQSLNRGNGSGLHNGIGTGRQASLESRAKILGITVEQLREKLKTQTMLEIAKELGLTEEQFHTKMSEAAQARWKEQGLSDEEIKTRLEAQQQRQENCDGDGGNKVQGGIGHGRNVQ